MSTLLYMETKLRHCFLFTREIHAAWIRTRLRAPIQWPVAHRTRVARNWEKNILLRVLGREYPVS
jgi:hypothetical protein